MGWCVLSYSIDGGVIWNLLDTTGGGSNFFVWTGNSGGRSQSSIMLSSLNGINVPVQFRFVFSSDYSISSDGFSIDDFSIDQVPMPTLPTSFTFSVDFQKIYNPCSALSDNITFLMYGNAANLNAGDSVSINVNFGDGTDTTCVTTVNNGYYFADAKHYYGVAELFSIQFIINGSNNFADSITLCNQLSFPGCGNIEGRLYLVQIVIVFLTVQICPLILIQLH